MGRVTWIARDEEGRNVEVTADTVEVEVVELAEEPEPDSE